MNFLHLGQRLLGQSIPVLCYHQVRPDSGMSPEKFGTQLDLVQRLGFETISLKELHRVITGRSVRSKPAAVITFDDCTLDNWIFAVPQLLKRKMHGVFFAITDFIVPGTMRLRADQTAVVPEIPVFATIIQNAIRGNCSGFMNQSEIISLVSDLKMEVYAHSAAHQACFTGHTQLGHVKDNHHWSHGPLTGWENDAPVFPIGSAYASCGTGTAWSTSPLEVSDCESRKIFCMEDFAESKRALESMLGQPCPFLCLPWGQYDKITQQAAQEAGFASLLTLDRIRNGRGTNPYRIGRIAVRDKKSNIWLASRLLAHAFGRPRGKE